MAGPELLCVVVPFLQIACQNVYDAGLIFLCVAYLLSYCHFP